MKRSALKRKASRTKQQEDIANYKKQRNFVVKLNKETKLQYFNNLGTLKNSKHFWDKCRHYFFNKRVHGDSTIILIEKEEITTNTNEIVEKETLFVNNDEIAKTLNKHFAEAVEKTSSFEWPSTNEDLIEEMVTKIIKKFKNIQVPSKFKANL